MPAFDPGTECHQAVLTALVALVEKSMRGIDQILGYPGKDRFVLFYYEPRGDEVIWRDSHSYGFSTGAGQLFIDQLASIADFHKVDVGSNGSPGTHVLLIDRADGRAFFAESDEAVQFVTGIPKKQKLDFSTINELAHRIWERSGRLEGRALENWLQAEAQLRAERRASPQSKSRDHGLV